MCTWHSVFAFWWNIALEMDLLMGWLCNTLRSGDTESPANHCVCKLAFGQAISGVRGYRLTIAISCRVMYYAFC